MTSAADVEIWHNATQSYDNGDLQGAINQFSSMSAVSSKIYFNMGSAYLTQQNSKEALKCFQDAVKKDAHFAVGFYMCGICYYQESRYAASIEQFQQALTCMRGNKLVDYKQLGLKYQLYECEVLLNQAVVHSKIGETEKAQELLQKALSVKVEKKHEKVDQSLQLLQAGKPLETMMPATNIIFRPSNQAVKNLKKKDYLGQAKVLYTSDPNDTTAGFSGSKLLQESRQNVLADIKKPGHRPTLRKVSAPARLSDSNIMLGKVLENKPPLKALPESPEVTERSRTETWGGKPTKPLPNFPVPDAPKTSQTSRRISAPACPMYNSDAGGQFFNTKKVPPKKSLPECPEAISRPRMETWAGKPSKPLPTSPVPDAPQRPTASPSFKKGPAGSSWDGQRSQNSAFRANNKSPNPVVLANGRSPVQPRKEPPRCDAPKAPPPAKRLPPGPAVTTRETNNNHDKHLVNIEVQFSFSVNIRCQEETSLSELKNMIQKQSIPSRLDIFYVDGLGKQKKLTDAALDHILQGSIDNPKLVCFQP